MFRAILINKDEQSYRAQLSNLDESALPEGDVRVKVHYSTLNYKDGLAITGKSPIVRSFPMIPELISREKSLKVLAPNLSQAI